MTFVLSDSVPERASKGSSSMAAGGAPRSCVSPSPQLLSGGGAAVCVYYQGRKVVDLWGGVRDDAGRA